MSNYLEVTHIIHVDYNKNEKYPTNHINQMKDGLLWSFS